ncbi:MAG: glycosyltransferase family 9 protein [Bacteroidia bacterium]|nr:glycosyltransferase family 9 protein [Bacteroidia bacterium]
MARFLVIQTAFLGDAVLTLPLLGRLRAAFPSAELHWIVRSDFQELFAHHPWEIRIWTWDKSWGGWLRLYRELRQDRWEAILVVQRFFRMGLLGLSLPAKHRITYDKNPLSFAYTHRVRHEFRAGLHEVGRVLALGSPLGVSPEPPPLPWLCPTLRLEVQKPYIVLSPTSRWPTKEAPWSYWADFLRSLPPSLHVYVTGLKGDRDRVEPLCRYHPRAANVAGQLSLPELVALVAGAHRVYTVDSAMTHIASALGVPTTTVFCSTIPAFGFGPLAPHSEIVEVKEPLACRPCGLHGKVKCPIGSFPCGYKLPKLEFRESYREVFQ